MTDIKFIDIHDKEQALELNVTQENDEMRMTVVNNSDNDCFIKEVKFFSMNIGETGFSDEAMVFSEGYQMLNYRYSPLKEMSKENDKYDFDKKHYRLKQNEGFYTAYNYVYFEEKDRALLVGATSCNRFTTEIRLNSENLEAVQVLEGKKIPANSSLELESFVVINGTDRNELLDKFASFIQSNHKTAKFHELPDGWCSWYCYGPQITENDIMTNLEVAKEKYPYLKYVQIDDGYQPHMGDWLMQTNKFKKSMKEICLDIKNSGFEGAMWVAPFIASEKSTLLREHPDWFIKDDDGKPLCTATLTFKGWRDTPWYFLDPTHPEAIEYIKDVFRIMKHEWKVNYFKLDANVWGALPFGTRYDDSLTCVEAYRKGMEAIWEACGEDTYILGCNAPLWPSLGVVSGMRIGNDIDRRPNALLPITSQCFFRNWMNDKLWANDPDCLVQADVKKGFKDFFKHSELPSKRHAKKSFYRYAAAFIRASGSVILSGDVLGALTPYDARVLKTLIDSPRVAAKFNFDYSVGTIETERMTEYLLFNQTKKKRTFELPINAVVTEVFSGKSFKPNGNFKVTLNPKDAIWLKIKK